MSQTEVVIAGGGFAGLACAKALAERGISVVVLERKKTAGQGMHTTGIIVGECAEEFAVPEHLTKRVTDVRLYAPSLRYVDLHAPEYFFLTTDTPGLMQFFSDEAVKAGAVVLYDMPYRSAVQVGDRINVNEGAFSCRFLIGADGPRSKVADDFLLGQNTKFLLGAEAEYAGLPLADMRLGGGENDNAFYCFLDQKLAAGYLGWVIPGVGVAQVGVAQRMPAKPDVDAFVARMKGVFDFSNAKVVARRGGLIPCGGLVKPFYRDNVILLGDSAGIVSPLTAGGIHTALHYGKALGEVIAAHVNHGGAHPGKAMARVYPRFRLKLGLRMIFEHCAPNWLLDLVITNPLFRTAASTVFFRKKKLK